MFHDDTMRSFFRRLAFRYVAFVKFVNDTCFGLKHADNKRSIIFVVFFFFLVRMDTCWWYRLDV